ncbi:MAG: hypothetical protein ACJAXA_000784 [Candidatus Aldehydirespiratoraceae bacterium]|jgi:hypothetical protein
MTMSKLTPAQKLLRVNIVLIAVLAVLLIVCLVRQLWFPAVVFATLMFSNSMQIVMRRRAADRPDGG